MALHRFALEHFRARWFEPYLLGQVGEVQIIQPKIFITLFNKPLNCNGYRNPLDLNLRNLFRELPAFAQYENSNKYKIFREVHHRSTGAQKTQESSRHSQAPMALLLRPSLECSVQPQPQCHQAIQPFRHQGISLKSVNRYLSVKTNLVICTL